MTNRNEGREVMICMGKGRSNRVVCCFCKKVLMKKEVGLHVYVCEKVPQEKLHIVSLGGSSVSFGTTSNSSRTNPLLGAPEDK